MIADLQREFYTCLKDRISNREPSNLYDPITYILSIGGKRLRPVLVLLGAEACGGDRHKAMDAAIAIEIFHNFSLVHDDIMDKAPLRRGQPSIHEKWNLNTGILSGDAMLILAYQFLEKYEPMILVKLVRLFSSTALQVCEGQQQDLDFEESAAVSLNDYLQMIARKTAVLTGAALEMGAITAKAKMRQRAVLYQFGLLLGIAYQIQDDYLDAFGNPKVIGKRNGGDIIAKKKTFPYLSAMETAIAEDRDFLKKTFTNSNESVNIHAVTAIFERSGAAMHTAKMIKHYTDLALNSLKKVEFREASKEILISMVEDLRERSS